MTKEDLLAMSWSYIGVALGMYLITTNNQSVIHWINEISFWGGSAFCFAAIGVLYIDRFWRKI